MITSGTSCRGQFSWVLGRWASLWWPCRTRRFIRHELAYGGKTWGRRVLDERTSSCECASQSLLRVSREMLTLLLLQCRPESLGVVSGITFLVCIIVGQLIFARKPDALATYNAALLSVCFMVLLGFADDVLDLRWRYKLLLPTVASLPLLCSYPGITHIIIPKPLRFLFAAVDGSTWWGRAVEALIIVDGNSDGAVVDLGMFYYLYMALLAVFATNSINILAGINGVEVGQTVIIACAVLFTNVLELTRSGGDITNPHLFSAALLLPFIGTSLGLIRYNWYPAQVFVGDTFCYFAGMTLAVSGILGHFSKTLLLFLAPQVFNFLYSVPQILKIVPCPRHRLPAVDPKTGLRYPSTYVAKDGSTRPNMTLINLVLRIFGPMREEQLTRTVLGIQAACCTVAIVVRYQLATLIYDDA